MTSQKRSQKPQSLPKQQTKTHLVIPDCQVAPGTPTIHLEWIGQFISDEYAEADLTVVCLGDFYDMESLCSYDRGKGAMENRRYVKDVDSGNVAMSKLLAPFAHLDCKRVFLHGNHEARITRAAEDNVQMEGKIGLADLDLGAWATHTFRKPVWLDGICYSHFLYNPMTGRPLAGTNLETRVKQVGHSFTVGHTQGLKWARVDTIKGPHIGLQSGSCYLHNPEFLGPQSVNYWRGVIVKHGVAEGDYDPMFVSLSYLCRRYEGKTLAQLKWRK